MEHLPEWLQQRYEMLLNAFKERESFSREEALQILNVPEGTGGDILSKLESAGYLRRGSDPLDKRIHLYRLVDISRARDLDGQLEEWRLRGMQNAPPLAQAIDRFWERCREALKNVVDMASVPLQPGLLVEQYVAGRVKLSDLRVVKKVNLGHLDKAEQAHAQEVLKLFDSSSNAYRSLTNVLLEHKKLDRDLAAGIFDLAVGDYASLDGMPLTPSKHIANKSLCPICRRFRQSQTTLALITGNPKMDSLFQTYRNNQSTRSSMRVCGYCFTAGWIDLPAAKITKSGQSINKEREYLFITTPLTRDDIQRLLDVIANRPSNEADHNADPELEAFNQFLGEKYGVQGFDSMSVLGLSARRLQELRGFVLPSANPLLRVVAVRVPVERLVGEDKVSGAVRQELVKATMYDFWQITGGSLHYNRITDAQFSVNGQPIELEDMRRANIAYRIADRYARVGRYRQLNSGLFMLLLAQPREAANRILRASHRV
ncbi:MarR family transcriptional regulator, partial [Candidatus Parcubacteria bacterium]